MVRVGRNVSVAYNGAGEQRITVGLLARAGPRRHLVEGPLRRRARPLSALPGSALCSRSSSRPGPVVGTFHSASSRTRTLRLFRPVLAPFYRRMDRVIAGFRDRARACVAALFPGPIGDRPQRRRPRPLLPVSRGSSDSTTARPTFSSSAGSTRGRACPVMQACAALARRRPSLPRDPGRGRAAPPDDRRMADGLPRGRVHFEKDASVTRTCPLLRVGGRLLLPARDGESLAWCSSKRWLPGVPIVATDIDGYRSVFTPGQEGLAIPPRDPRSLADACDGCS